MKYEELQTYLRNFINSSGDAAPYDFVGALNLFLASLDNIRTNHLDDDLEEINEILTEEQKQFLAKLSSLAKPGE